MNGTTPRYVIPTEMKWSGGIFPSSKLYPTQVIFATWVDSSTPLRSGRNDNGVTFLRIRLLFLECFTLPRFPHQSGLRPASFPQGKLLYRAIGGGFLLIRLQKWGNIRPPNNCQLSIVHCQLEKTVNCQL